MKNVLKQACHLSELNASVSKHFEHADNFAKLMGGTRSFVEDPINLGVG